MSPPRAASAPIDALQTALAAEHAAVFVYGALGGQTSQSDDPTLYAEITDAYVTHRDRRDRLVRVIEAAGRQPVAAEPGYDLPVDLSTPIAVADRALQLERACAATYAFVVASTSEDDRRWAVDALLDTAVRELGFGGRPERLPGL
ncbi:ferritin-like domain-containing protein [Nocardioides sp. HM23]|uniref:ferritin-like domain-containing protein n=1 Tax=Nocardioides bizhenqiangii TaxID=3095076 RepID=UPI002AC9FF2F|nr:ferritin-like domain-containing protein [Nocardioides sp. HM23]MDZ5620773.1 ferritin-like domain-containing protein [Nocardioides sp. HM23]